MLQPCSCVLMQPRARAAFTALLELGAQLRALSAVGWPPLFYAVENRRVKQ